MQNISRTPSNNNIYSKWKEWQFSALRFVRIIARFMFVWRMERHQISTQRAAHKWDRMKRKRNKKQIRMACWSWTEGLRRATVNIKVNECARKAHEIQTMYVRAMASICVIPIQQEKKWRECSWWMMLLVDGGGLPSRIVWTRVFYVLNSTRENKWYLYEQQRDNNSVCCVLHLPRTIFDAIKC